MTGEEERGATRRRFSSRIITLRIGSPPHTITAHEACLLENSAYFRAALEKHWKESKTGTIDLPEDDPDTVATYTAWLYGSEVAKVTPQYASPVAQRSDYEHLANLCVFGEKIQDDAFCDTVLQTLMRQLDTTNEQGQRMFPHPDIYSTIYAGTPEGSPARRLLVAAAVEWRRNWKERAQTDLWPADFLHDFIEALLQARPTPVRRSFYDRREQWMKQKK